MRGCKSHPGLKVDFLATIGYTVSSSPQYEGEFFLAKYVELSTQPIGNSFEKG